jgi:hypothetical protein
MSSLFLGAYWKARAEDAAAAAARLAVFLGAVARIDARLARWFSVVTTGSAGEVVPLTPEGIMAHLQTQKTDAGGHPMPTLGVRFHAWTEAYSTIDATVGAYSPRIRNAVVLQPEGHTVQDSAWRQMLQAAVDAFDPDDAVVSSVAIMKSAGTTRPSEAAWLSRARGAELREDETRLRSGNGDGSNRI